MENDDYNDPECIAFLDVLQLGNYLWYCVLCIYGKIGMTSPAGCIHKHLQIINNKPQSGPVAYALPSCSILRPPTTLAPEAPGTSVQVSKQHLLARIAKRCRQLSSNLGCAQLACIAKCCCQLSSSLGCAQTLACSMLLKYCANVETGCVAPQALCGDRSSEQSS
eukprot:scaffold4513_cov17-Tisochrysis_lutea.AAC.1